MRFRFRYARGAGPRRNAGEKCLPWLVQNGSPDFAAASGRRAVRVELYAEPERGGAPFLQEMCTNEPFVSDPGLWIYSTVMSRSRPADFTPRVLPYHSFETPLEIDRVVWQK
jgi:hypothetical protein